MKMSFFVCLLAMPILATIAIENPAELKLSGEIAAENFVRRIPALWAHGTEDELYEVTTNTVDSILSIKDAERRDLAFTYCADIAATLDVELRNDEDYSRSLDIRQCLVEMMLRHSGKTDVGILHGFDCRVKFYETLKRESVKFPVVKLPRFVDDLKVALASKNSITNNVRYASKGEFTPEGIAKRRKEMRELARDVSKRRKRAEYGACVRRGMEGEEKCYYDNTLEYFYGKLSDTYRTNVIEKARATIGRYPKWYNP